MKTRSGFVSNSSSSSFIIGVKGELTEEKIMRAFKIGVDSPLYCVAKNMTGVLMSADPFTLEELIEDRCYEDRDDLDDIEKKIFEKGFIFYSGYASDDSGVSVESALSDTALDYEDDNLILFKEAGY